MTSNPNHKIHEITRNLCCVLILLCLFTLVSAAQVRRPNRNVLPRVGTIKDYPATGLMTGCGNLYFFPASSRGASNTAYVFLARGDGSNAWMNLGGRDVRLHQIKSSSRDSRSGKHYYYRVGRLRVDVVFENFKPESAPVEEGDSMFKMTITLRQGPAVRIVKALGDSDC